MRLLLLGSLFFSVINLYGQNGFLRYYDGYPTGGVPYCLEKTPDGGFLIGGNAGDPDTPTIADMQLMKIDATGHKIWEVRDHVTNFDNIQDMVVYDDSTIFCAAQLDANHIALVKRNISGHIIWIKQFFQPDTISHLLRIIKLRDGNLVIAGDVNRAFDSDSAESLILKADTSGNILWLTRYFSPLGNGASDVIETPDSSLFFVGRLHSIDTAAHLDYFFWMLGKLDKQGNLQWVKTYDGTFGYCLGLTLLNNGNLALAGAELSDAQMLIVNDTGLVLTTRKVDITMQYERYFLRVKSEDNTIVLLEHYYNGPANDSFVDIKIWKYSLAADSFYYEKLFGQPNYQNPSDMQLLPDGGIAVTFHEFGDSSTCFHCTGLLVVDSTGCNPDLCATSISEVATPKLLSVYPNPFMDVVTIRSPEGELLRQITIMDITGSLVWHQNLTNPVSTYAISLPSLAAGVFFITAKSNQNYYYAKIIKE